MFVCDDVGGASTTRGIQTFATATGLHVHYQLSKEELGEDRTIDCNHRHAHLVDQHGLILRRGDPGFVGGRAVNAPGADGPGTPRKITEILLHPALHRQSSGRGYETLIAHELCHAVNVRHHGEKDPWFVEWKAGTYGGKTVIYERVLGSKKKNKPSGQAKIVVVRDSNFAAVPPEKFLKGVVAGAYVVDGYRDTRRWIQRGESPEAPRGTRLCADAQGSGPYGDAATDEAEGPRQRGNCAKQVRVNDKTER